MLTRHGKFIILFIEPMFIFILPAYPNIYKICFINLQSDYIQVRVHLLIINIFNINFVGITIFI